MINAWAFINYWGHVPWVYRHVNQSCLLAGAERLTGLETVGETKHLSQLQRWTNKQFVHPVAVWLYNFNSLYGIGSPLFGKEIRTEQGSPDYNDSTR